MDPTPQPLSKPLREERRSRISRELGSRHRAAIGVTEENDSIAVVVSEETGRISLVEDGNVELGLDPERLRERLKELLRVRRSDMDRREAGYSFG